VSRYRVVRTGDIELSLRFHSGVDFVADTRFRFPYEGQKQRVSLARAAYSRPDVVLLDDPLSALDAGTSKLVFENLIKGPNAYFSDVAVVLVTHAAHFLNRVDRILLIVGGENKFHGSWNELVNFHPNDDVSTLLAVDSIRSSVQEAAGNEASKPESKSKENEERMQNSPRGLDGKTEARALVQAEVREHGLSSVATWLLWFHQAGGIAFIALTIISLGFDRTAYVAVEYWLARWTDGAYEGIAVFGVSFPPQTEGISAQSQYLIVYSLLLLVSCIATTIR
jgi:ATP-binding cassette, subfamily C (CFTR/MRP), member 1